jgi:hypothetical protein
MNENNQITDLITKLLGESTREMDPTLVSRLQSARFEAVARLPARALKLKPALAGHGHEILFGSWHAPRSRVVSFALAVVFVLSGMIGYQWWHEEMMEDELGSLDAKLLSSELPPSAFAHDSFGEWLQDSR